MKAKLVLTVLLSFVFYLLSSQVPQGLSYQAIARDTDGPLANKTLKVKLSILSDTTGFKATGAGNYLWEEEFLNVLTSQFGAFNLALGTGTRVGGSLTSFNQMDWTTGPKYVGVKIANPTTYVIMGSSKLWTVPYAMVADNLTGPVKKLSIAGTTTDYSEALFEVKNKDGMVVFAVYPEGVRINIDNGDPSKGVKGGFAIGGFDKSKATPQDLFVVTNDSIRAYIDSTGAKAVKGGFAIGSFDRTKGGKEQYLRVTRDSVRIYINDVPAKAVKGGFAIGSFNRTKALIPQYLTVNPNRTTVQVNDSTKGFMVSNIQTGVSQNFMDMTVENYFIGYQAGTLTTPGVGDIGKYNSFMGYQTGVKNVTGKKNVYLGYQSGYESIDANYNVLIGNEAGKLNANGANNTFVGYWSGQNNNGSYNTFIGERAGNRNSTGTFNVFVGARSGMNVITSTATYNTMIGSYSGYYSTDATNNVFIGGKSGMNNRTGDFNVCIGNEAGYTNKISNRLYIANSMSYPPLIYGEFDNKRVVVNDTLPHAMTFYVNGAAGGTGAWQNLSDIRLKKNIETIREPVEKIMKMHGVVFEWKDNNLYDPGKHIGFIAQEMDAVMPEIVKHDGDYLSMQYAPITAVLVEAFKIQQQKIMDQQRDLEDVKKLCSDLADQNRMLLKRIENLEDHSGASSVNITNK